MLPRKALLVGLTGFTTVTLAAGRAAVPADSLLQHDLRPLQRSVLRGLAGWQRFTYGHNGFNCQFEPSCSQFMALAIDRHGTPAGSVMGLDRIIRCNPAARRYHRHSTEPRLNSDGRILEPLDLAPSPQPAKSPCLAVALSIVPGLGRAYAGRPVDGLFSFILVGSLLHGTVDHYRSGQPGWTLVDGTFTVLVWSADFYGAYWSARHRGP